MSESSKKPALKPAKTVREGAIAANIWKRQAPSGFEYYDFSLSRSWKAKSSGREGYSPNFFIENEEAISVVVRGAVQWIESQQASLQAGKPSDPTDCGYQRVTRDLLKAANGSRQTRRLHRWSKLCRVKGAGPHCSG